MMENKSNTHKILLKPTWGRMSVSPGNLQKLSEDILEKALHFYGRGGKLFIIQHAPEQDLLAQMILGSLFSQILSLKKEVKIFLPDVEFSRSAEILSTEFLLVYNLPQFSETLGLLAESNQKQMIIATGTETQWEQAKFNIPYFYYQSFPSIKNGWQEYFEIDFENQLKIYEQLTPTEKMIFERVVALDSMGIAVPMDLLANSLNLSVKETIDLVTEIEEKGLLECLEDEKQAELLVCSNSAQIARKFIKIKSQFTESFEITLAKVINSVESEYKDERYTILNTFHSALNKSSNLAGNNILSRPAMRELIKTYREKFMEIWSAGDEIEHLLWGKILEELQLFKQSAKVFDEGLRRNRTNPFLRQAEARMTGKWAIFNRSKLDLAKKLFSQLTNETAQNPYFLQARGVFESNMDEPRKAGHYFKTAYSVAVGEENKAFILTAWANLEIEQSNFVEAREKLNQIQSAEHSPYLPHLWAKLNFYRGEYSEANEKLKELFAFRPLSIEGWNMLGEMSLKRAHWKKAETALKIALGINPENVPTLRALGDLETNSGKMEMQRGNFADASTHFETARKYFAKSLEIEPLNFYSKVSNSVVLRYEGDLLKLKGEIDFDLFFETAIKDLTKLYQKYAFDDFITHNLGETYFASGNYQKAKTYFEETRTLAGVIGLAKAEIGLKNTNKAIEHLNLAEDRLLESKLKHFERVRSFNALAEVWINLEDLEKAESLAQTSFDLDNENGFTLRLFAKINRILGKETEADLFEKKAGNLANEELEEFLTEKI